MRFKTYYPTRWFIKIQISGFKCNNLLDQLVVDTGAPLTDKIEEFVETDVHGG